MKKDCEITKHFIYLLPTKNGRYFKLGKSSIGQVRTTCKLNKIYNFDFNRGLVFFADRETVYTVETELKKSIPNFKHVYGKVDGSSEIREFKYFGKALALLREKGLEEFTFHQIYGKAVSMQTKCKTNNSNPTVRGVYRKIRRSGRLDLSDYCILYPLFFTKYYFDCDGYLNLEFIKDYSNHYKLISNKYIKYYCYGTGYESRTVFRLLNNDYDQILQNEIFQILCINPTQEEKNLAIEDKQRSLNKLKELCDVDSPICFEDFLNDKLEYINPSLIFNDLDQIRITKLEDNFLLRYRSGAVKRIFYRDSVYYSQYKSREDRDNYYMKRFERSELLEQKILILNDDQAKNYFWNCAKFYGIQLRMKRPRINAYGFEG